MILASGEGQLVFLVVMAVFGLINWLSSKATEGAKKAPPRPSSPDSDPASSRRTQAEPEDERMRRFLEALGVPTETPAAPPPRVAPRLPTQPKRQNRQPAPPPIPAERRPRSLDEMPAPTLPVERLFIPELVTSAVPDFETVSSRISALPSEFPATGDEQARPSGPTMSETLRAALSSPRQLRSAFILTEVFGPPPGLRQP